MKDNLLDGEYLITKDYTDWMVKTGGYARDKTLRDEFAGQAMTTMFYPAIMESIRTDEDVDCLKLSEFAYTMADAMLKERNK
jgi:hypothetical protein